MELGVKYLKVPKNLKNPEILKIPFYYVSGQFEERKNILQFLEIGFL